MEPRGRMTGAERAVASAEDPDGYFARAQAESRAAALAEVRAMDKRARAAFRRRVLRVTGLRALCDRVARRR